MDPAALIALALLAPPAPVRFDAAHAPAALATPLQRGAEAIASLEGRLRARLEQAIADGDEASAVAVCRTVAPTVAAEVGAAAAVRIGRTSDRLRNPVNAPPTWALGAVTEAAGKRAEEVRPVVVDLGDRVGLLTPIAVSPACSRCHGRPGEIPPAVSAQLGAVYRRDLASGYAAGEHRGFFWVEVPK